MKTILIVAKSPVPGQAKTRLGPELTPHQCAALAAAALLDSLDVALAVTEARVVVALTGSLHDAPAGRQIAASLRHCTVIGQRGSTFGERLAHAYRDAAGPFSSIVQVGMDTPQITPDLLRQAFFALETGSDAAIGSTEDGGWWALGLRRARHARVLSGVPMSTPETYQATAAAVAGLGLATALLPRLIDVDTAADAAAVAELIPDTRFGQLAALLLGATGSLARGNQLSEVRR
ncbi:MAG: DUF2064 domain-containing protein [Actinomycetota bacterium]|nr:DUF2064 domain-containing protein [Actinomycetota bacterium]